MKREQVTQGQIDLAMLDLLHEIACGREYPDAEWLVSRSTGVPAEALREAYDAACAHESRLKWIDGGGNVGGGALLDPHEFRIPEYDDGYSSAADFEAAWADKEEA